MMREQPRENTPLDAEMTIGSRKDSRMNEPKFPEPVEEARQRFSTPRRNNSRSPHLSKGSTLSGKASGLKPAQYPVEIRKHKVIKGPVLKSAYEGRAIIQNGKLKVAAK